MGCCVSKRPVKVDALSHGQLVGKEHDKNCSRPHKSSEGKPLNCLEITKETSVDRVSEKCSDVNEIQEKGAEHRQDSRQQQQQDMHQPSATINERKPKAVAFDINFNEMDIHCQSTPRKFPRRLKKLEGLPQLTAEELRRKQEQVEENRSKELQRKTETSSKHHRDLFQAREYERLRNAQTQMELKFLASERNRQHHVKEVINKQREREQKAKKVREKSCVELEGSVVHVDETYNSGSSSADEGWPGEEQDERSGTELEDENSIDEFFETNSGAHFNKINNYSAGFLCL